MKRKYFIFFTFALLLTMSIGLKIQRYMVSYIDENLRLASIISTVLQHQSWIEIPRPPVDKPQALSVFTYQKTMCEKPLRVTFLNFGDATSNALKTAIGTDVLFIYDGKISPIFPSKKQFYKVILKSMQNMIRFSDNHEMPIIAVSNNSSMPECDNKIVELWADIEAEFNK